MLRVHQDFHAQRTNECRASCPCTPELANRTLLQPYTPFPPRSNTCNCPSEWLSSATLVKSRRCTRRIQPQGTSRSSTWGICTRRAGKLNKARSQLYRSQILQENMRWKALAEIYTMHSFAQICNRNFLSKFCEKFANFAKIVAKYAKSLLKVC